MDFLYDGLAPQRSLIISTSEVMTREGFNVQKGMNFRDDEVLHAVLLMIERDGEYRESWNEEESTLTMEGHDSVAEGSKGKGSDQLLMYASGRVTENGKFYKAAHAFNDGLREYPLQVQVYEKIDAGVWFDKGIFNLVGANTVKGEVRKVVTFTLKPADAARETPSRSEYWKERMILAREKSDVWKRADGRCEVCSKESSLHFVAREETRLVCDEHCNL